MKSKLPDGDLHVWGSAKHSLWDISLALRELKVTHTVRGARGVKTILAQRSNPLVQPMPVHLTSHLHDVRPGAVNFISAALGLLADTNVSPFPRDDLDAALRLILTTSVAKPLVVTSRTADDYVQSLVKPSVLNKVQTEVYRIQPYALRKTVQRLVLDFFNSRISIADMKKQLARSTKTESLVPILVEGLALRSAVALTKTKSIEEVEAETGCSSFELQYLLKASTK